MWKCLSRSWREWEISYHNSSEIFGLNVLETIISLKKLLHFSIIILKFVVKNKLKNKKNKKY